MAGALTLADYPTEVVYIACRRCPRLGKYRRTTLVAPYSAEAPLPEVLPAIRTCCLPCRNAPKSTIIYANLGGMPQILIFAQQ